MAHRVLVALLLIGSAAHAQAAFGSGGQVVPFGTVSYTHTSAGADVNLIFVAPGAMWFPTNNVAIGGQLIYAFADFGPSVHEVGFEPLVGFAVPLADHVAFGVGEPPSVGRSLDPEEAGRFELAARVAAVFVQLSHRGCPSSS